MASTKEIVQPDGCRGAYASTKTPAKTTYHRAEPAASANVFAWNDILARVELRSSCALVQLARENNKKSRKYALEVADTAPRPYLCRRHKVRDMKVKKSPITKKNDAKMGTLAKNS